MAKRKAAGRTRGGRKTAAKKRAPSRKTARTKRPAPKRRAPARRTGRPAKTKAKRRAAAKKSTSRAVKKVDRKAAKKPVKQKATPTKPQKVVARPAASPASSKRAAAAVPLLRKPPGLDRERRIVSDEDEIIQATPPSSLDLDRSASAVRTGRRALKDRFDEHTETSPALTGGDVDADWESAYSVGDEAPGGDNPTPDQDIVDDIGKAIGVEYQDNEELKSEEKIAKRDRNRWELDPASSDDWDDR